MSHAVVLVIVPKGADVEKEVSRLMTPFSENGEWGRKGSKWDWWVIGGRWTGALTDYDPAADPANIVKCEICAGTGKRQPPPSVGAGDVPCNGCRGEGKHVSWILQPYEGDVQPVAVVLERKFVPYAILLPTGNWLERATLGWFGSDYNVKATEDEWAEQIPELLKPFKDTHNAVVVDYHV